jgi:hypothetical protein
VNPAVNNDAEAPGPIIDEKFHILDPSIDKTDIKYLTSDIETLLNKTVAPQLVSYTAVSAAAAAAGDMVVDYKFCLWPA